MEHCLILVVTVFKVCFPLVEILLQHRNIILLKCVEERQVTIVINYIWSWLDLIDNLVLLVQTHDVLYGLPLIVLSSTSEEERVIPTEPIEYLLIAISCTLKERILTKSISHLKTLELEILEYLQHLQILVTSCQENRSLSIEISLQTFLWFHLKEFLDQLIVLV